MRDFIEIGSTPHDEDCAQVGSENYAKRAKRECWLFMEQIRKHYPEPECGYLTIKSHPHDFGTYYEVRACYDDEDEESTKWAFDIEGDAKGVLCTWDAEFHPINDVLQGESRPEDRPEDRPSPTYVSAREAAIDEQAAEYGDMD